MATLLILVVVVVAVTLGVALAYVPMQLLMGQMARNIRQFIQRQRDRRHSSRETPDRRKSPTV